MPRPLIVAFLLILFLSGQPVTAHPRGQELAQALPRLEYVSPLPGAQFVSPGTTIAIRPAAPVDPRALPSVAFTVTGAKSGRHAGKVVLADDRRTIIYKPVTPFALGETVQVSVAGPLFAATSFAFSVSQSASARSPVQPVEAPGPGDKLPRVSIAAPVTQTKYATLPADFPVMTVTVPANGTAPGYVFLSNFAMGPSSAGKYLLMLDNSGDPVYYQKRVTTGFDFKKQPTGVLSYYDSDTSTYAVLDSSYNRIDSVGPGNGYVHLDQHDLQILPENGHALITIDDVQTLDLSQIAPGGYPTATVIGLIVQELDTSKNVVFEWRSWDHFLITDTVVSLTTPAVDYVHGNAVERDQDGNLMISSRHLDEVTKIDRQTGAIIWRLGGKNNQFTFLNDNMFVHQHDIRRLANGHITLFDNRNGQTPVYSRMVEYAIDETAKTVNRVWEGRNQPDTYSFAMGDGQRLPNGNSLIGWGAGYPPAALELAPDGSELFELMLPPPNVSYRAFRFPWHGYPIWDPTLVLTQTGNTTTLYFSWNGATEIASYQVYGGNNQDPLRLLATVPKAGFETTLSLNNVDPRVCYFVVMPVDAQGIPTRLSNRAYTGTSCGDYTYWMPVMLR